MIDDKDHEQTDLSADEEVTLSTDQEDDAGDGLGVGGNIASIIYDVENDIEGQGTTSGDDDAGSGLGTGGEVRAPQD